MKKTLLTLFLIFSVNAFSQWNGSAGVSITNYNLKSNHQNFDNYQDTGSGFYAKISRTVFLNNIIFIEPGLGFLATETKENIGPGITTVNLYVPIKIGARLRDRFSINTGLQPNFIVSAKSTQKSQIIDIRNDYKSSYINYIVGATFSPVPDKIHITFNYATSLGSVFEKNYMSGTDFLQNVISIGLKVSFRKSKKEE